MHRFCIKLIEQIAELSRTK